MQLKSTPNKQLVSRKSTLPYYYYCYEHVANFGWLFDQCYILAQFRDHFISYSLTIGLHLMSAFLISWIANAYVVGSPITCQTLAQFNDHSFLLSHGRANKYISS